MKFGVFYEHQLPRPWNDDSEYVLLQNALEQIELADSLGIEYVWEVEHHFLEEYSHSSAPEVFLAAASQRTKNIRLGHGIVQTPPPFNHPARVAERISMLDLVSNGRADFGTGESSSEAELGGFNIDPIDKREMWEEGLRVAIRCMTETPVHRPRGQVRHHAAAQRRSRSRARSRTRRSGSRAVAATRSTSRHRRGSARSRSRSSIPKKRGRGSTTTTRTLASEGVPIADAVNANMACVTTFMCHDDEETALRAWPRRCELLRLLARALLRVRSPRAGPHRRVGRVPGPPGRARLRPRRGAGGRAPTRTGSARRSSTRGSVGCAARSARPTRSATTSSATRSAVSTR